MLRRRFKAGDRVIYTRLKVTTHPGRRAHGVEASANGDDYYYFVDKFWVVADVLADQKLLLRTRRGKTHVVSDDDRNLRHASLWDRIRFRERFRDAESLSVGSI
jgi:hypothetical protein